MLYPNDGPSAHAARDTATRSRLGEEGARGHIKRKRTPVGRGVLPPRCEALCDDPFHRVRRLARRDGPAHRYARHVLVRYVWARPTKRRVVLYIRGLKTRPGVPVHGFRASRSRFRLMLQTVSISLCMTFKACFLIRKQKATENKI